MKCPEHPECPANHGSEKHIHLSKPAAPILPRCPTHDVELTNHNGYWCPICHLSIPAAPEDDEEIVREAVALFHGHHRFGDEVELDPGDADRLERGINAAARHALRLVREQRDAEVERLRGLLRRHGYKRGSESSYSYVVCRECGTRWMPEVRDGHPHERNREFHKDGCALRAALGEGGGR